MNPHRNELVPVAGRPSAIPIAHMRSVFRLEDVEARQKAAFEAVGVPLPG